jgi:hypothetical protein
MRHRPGRFDALSDIAEKARSGVDEATIYQGSAPSFVVWRDFSSDRRKRRLPWGITVC